MVKKNKCIIFCNCSAGFISDMELGTVRNKLSLISTDIFVVNDMCGTSLDRKEFYVKVNDSYENIILVACYPRAVKNLLKQNEIELNNLEIINMRTTPAREIEEKLISGMGFISGEAKVTELNSFLEVPPWYPVVDYSRCTHCGKCFKFCLFGVYSFNNNNLKVVNPLSCKNNCPACGRNCPASALIFPRVKEGGELAGANTIDYKPYNSSTAGTSMLHSLEERSALRQNIFKKGVINISLEERAKAMKELKKGK